MNRISPLRLTAGLLVVLIGASLLFDALGFSVIGDLLGKFWPTIIIILGIIMLMGNKGNYLWAILVIAVGNILLLNSLDILEVNVWRLVWPALIIIAGLSILINRSGAPGRTADEPGSSVGRDEVSAILSGSEQRNGSSNFQSGRLTAVLGGVVYDLRKATIKKEATIDVFTFWGGIEIIVPESVEVQCSALNILGGIEDKTTRPGKSDAPVLRIVGNVVMAGVEIKN